MYSIAIRTIASGAVKLASVLLAFFLFLMAARTTSNAQFGYFSSAYAIATILSYVAAVGQNVVVLRFWPRLIEQHSLNTAISALRVSASWTFFGAISVGALVAVAGSAMTAWGSGDHSALWIWTGVLVFALVLAEFSASALRARGQLFLALVPRDVLWRGVVVVVLFTGGKGTAESVMRTLAVVLLAIAILQFGSICASIARAPKGALPPSERKAMTKATAGLWVSSSVISVLDYVGTVVAGFALGPSSAGGFFAADRLSRLLMLPLAGADQLAAPLISAAYHGGRDADVRRLLHTVSLAATVVSLVGFGGLVLAGPQLLSIFSPSYSGYYPVLVMLAAAQVVNAACGLNTTLLDMTGHELDLLRIRLIWGPGGLLLMLLCAQPFGLAGIALATAATTVGWNIHATLECRRSLGILPVLFLAARHGR